MLNLKIFLKYFVTPGASINFTYYDLKLPYKFSNVLYVE